MVSGVEVAIVSADAARADWLAAHARTLWPAAALATAAEVPPGARPALLLVDLALPPDGLAACRRLRAHHPRAPILALGRPGAPPEEELRALDAGADAYAAPRVAPVLLLARLRALARGTALAPPPVPSGLAIDAGARAVCVDGAPVALTPTEYVLLATLAATPGAFVTPAALLAAVWGPRSAGRTHYPKVYVDRLRRKLGDTAAVPRFIEGRRGEGYRLLTPGAGGGE